MARVVDKSDALPLDQRILTAIENNDVEEIERMLKSNEITVNHHITISNRSILSTAIISVKMDIVQRIFNIASELDQTIELAEPLHWAFCPIRHQPAKTESNEILEILMNKFHRLDPCQRIQTVFIQRKSNGWNAFLRACMWGLDELVMKCLDLIHDSMDPECDIDWFWDEDRLFNVFSYFDALRKAETRLTMIERIPFTRDLVNQHGIYDVTNVPLLSILKYGDSPINNRIDAAKLLITHGSADIDLETGDGKTVLCELIEVEAVEFLLRCGCKIDIYDDFDQSPLSTACRKYTSTSVDKKKNMAIIENLLSFGVSLQDELYLYEIDELPDKYLNDQYTKRRSAGIHIDLLLLKKLKELRRSHKMLSLKRICRKAIRQYLKPNANEIIPDLDGVSATVKKFLLMEEEEGVLFDLKMGNLLNKDVDGL